MSARGTRTGPETLIVIDARHFYTMVILEDDRVVKAADIVKYMLGWNVKKVQDYCRFKDWKADVYPNCNFSLTLPTPVKK